MTCPSLSTWCNHSYYITVWSTKFLIVENSSLPILIQIFASRSCCKLLLACNVKNNAKFKRSFQKDKVLEVDLEKSQFSGSTLAVTSSVGLAMQNKSELFETGGCFAGEGTLAIRLPVKTPRVPQTEGEFCNCAEKEDLEILTSVFITSWSQKFLQGRNLLVLKQMHFSIFQNTTNNLK